MDPGSIGGVGVPLCAPGRRGKRYLHDGAGLYSPGRWRPSDRSFGLDPLATARKQFNDLLRKWEKGLVAEKKPKDLNQVLFGEDV